MGERLRTFEFIEGYYIRTNSWPLDEWLDGSIWQLTRGQDFHSTLENMRGTVHYHARRRGLYVRTRCVYELDGRQLLVFQAYRRGS